MKYKITLLLLIAYVNATAQWPRVTIGTPRVTIGTPRVTIGTPSVTIGKPKITIGNKPFEGLTKGVQKVLDETGKIIPEEAKVLTTKLFGEAAKVNGQLIQIYSDNNSLISDISLEAVNLYQEIAEPIDENLIKIKNASLSTIGVTLPPNIDKAMSDYISLNSNGIAELERLYVKSTNIQNDILDGTAKSLDDFSKYLLLTTNGFPAKTKMPQLTKQAAIASLNINATLLPKIVDRLLQNDIPITKNATYEKPFQIVSVKSGSLKFDPETNTLLIELNDAKIRHNQPSAGMRVSATISIKKLRSQVLMADNGDGTISLKLKLIYLDVDNLLPKLDETLCYYLQDAVVSKFSQTFKLSDLIRSKAKVAKSDITALNITTTHLNTKLFINSNSLGVTYHDNTDNTIDQNIPFNSAALAFKEDFVKNLINKALDSTHGVRISLDKKCKDFDITRNHYRIVKLNYVKLNSDNSMDIGAEGSVHLRRFLGRKPKINILFSNIGIKLLPVLRTDSGPATLEMTMVPVADSLVVTGSPLKAKMLRKIVKLFKFSKTPIKLDPADLEKTKDFNFNNPFDPTKKLLPENRDMALKVGDHQWKFVFDFK
ncbi:hypothetical protein SRABI27_03741 [Pedobacter sp. Bi27]|uniref:hypothetical protein n=1 Tax=Pedobacter sp. Bi27 TaxID=2822351 RepID=UPI001DF5AB7B|nr:hypothetical protein [Pedobacter sp. Bi27]CAH0279806.1 hypothetical protein SRABI27_03741 [Pedobacter sp. Bi27]